MNFKKIVSSVMALSVLTAGFAFADTDIVKNILPTESITAEAATTYISSGPWQGIVTGTNPKTCKVSGYTGSDKTVSIPYAIAGYSVTEIGEFAFSGNNVVEVVNIPRGVSKIDSYAFYSAKKLKQLRTSPSVTSIGSYACYNCDALTKIDLCYGNERIEDYAFADCGALTQVSLSYTLNYVGANAFSYCTKLSNVSISNANCTFGQFAFKNCYNLTNFDVSNYNVLHSLFSTGALAGTNKSMHVNSISLWSYKAGQPYLITNTRDYVNAHKNELLQYNVPFYKDYRANGGV